MTNTTVALSWFNIYAGNKTPSAAIDAALSPKWTGTKPHFAGLGEAYNAINRQTLRLVCHDRKYREFYGVSTTDRRRGPKDNPVLTRMSLPNRGEIAIKGCDASTPQKIAPERWIHASLSRVQKNLIASVVVHPHAATAGLDAKHVDRVEKTGEFWDHVDALLASLQKLGYHTFVIGDINLREGQSYKNATTPWQVFARRKLAYKMTGLDCLAYPKGSKLGKFAIIRGDRFGSDHNGFAAKVIL